MDNKATLLIYNQYLNLNNITPENPTTIIIIKYTIIFQFNRDSQLLVDLPSLEPGALSPITFFSF